LFLLDCANNTMSPANYTVCGTFQRNVMRIIARCVVISALFAAGSLLFCSFDDSTNLGSDIINNVEPDKVNVGRHYREYILDSSGLVQKYSVSRTDEIIHNVTGSVMVLGKRDGESAFGFVRFVCPPDTDTTNHNRVSFRPTDSLLSIKMVFTRADSGERADFRIIYNKSEVLTPDSIMPVVGTISFPTKDTLIDTIEISDSTIKRAIFDACTTTAKSAFPGTQFCFDIVSLQNDSLIRLYGGTPKLLVSVDKDTLPEKIDSVTKSYSVERALYVVKEDTLVFNARRSQPVSSYAPYRTAVFEFDPSPLWTAMEDTQTSTMNRLLSAGFMIRHPGDDTNALYVKYGVSTFPLQSGYAVDTMFDSSSILISIPRDTVAFANVCETLQRYARQNPRPVSLFLYLRLTFNTSAALSSEEYEQWRTVTWDVVPYLKTIIYLP
jgi:hypothetical protein